MQISGSSSLRIVLVCTGFGLFGPEDEGDMIIRNFGNYLTDDMAYNPIHQSQQHRCENLNFYKNCCYFPSWFSLSSACSIRNSKPVVSTIGQCAVYILVKLESIL
jgi:hypothetical protein